MANLQINIGEKNNRLTLIELKEKDGRHKKALFLCDCGNYTITRISRVKSNNAKSCGCLNKEMAKAMFDKGLSKTHGFTSDKKSNNYNLYLVRNSIKTRCYNKKSREYKWYGGRGISMCKEWKNNPVSFINWCLDNGYEKGLHIDRINNDGNYEPNNCRFVTSKVNMNNTRSNVRYLYLGENLTVSEMSYKYGINYGTLRSRITRSKMSIKDAIETPIRIINI